jgi:beta-lactamase class A
MAYSRRTFFKTAAATLAAASAPHLISAATTASQPVTPDQIIDLFEPLPGDKGIKILAPAANGQPEFVAHLNSGKRLFVASANKTFALCQALRQAESRQKESRQEEGSPGLIKTLEDTELTLDATVWSIPGSPFFNPPNLKGTVSERATLEAMIMSSDNTATDMIFQEADVEEIRAFIASLGLAQTQIPDSTRAFSAYLFGAKNYKTISWKQLKAAVARGELAHPFLNDVETFASSANDLVSYYSLALQGAFFEHAETLNEFRRILTLCDFIYLIPLPLGVSAYAKSGNADVPDFHARSIAGGLFVAGRWIYFAFVLNWYSAEPDDHATVNQFFSAITTALTLVKNSFS